MSGRSISATPVMIGGVIPVTPGPWEDRWRELGYLPPVVGAQMPAHDGDMAQLEELAERIFAALPRLRPWTAPVRNGNGGTTITVKRVCNGCDEEIGDATKAELERAVAGLPLADVTFECTVCGPAVLELDFDELYTEARDAVCGQRRFAVALQDYDPAEELIAAWRFEREADAA